MRIPMVRRKVTGVEIDGSLRKRFSAAVGCAEPDERNQTMSLSVPFDGPLVDKPFQRPSTVGEPQEVGRHAGATLGLSTGSFSSSRELGLKAILSARSTWTESASSCLVIHTRRSVYPITQARSAIFAFEPLHTREEWSSGPASYRIAVRHRTDRTYPAGPARASCQHL